VTFLDRLDKEARELLLAVARPVSHAKGERLVRHGDPSVAPISCATARRKRASR